jgi:tetratricopeptide (TPR) repeat protein
MPDYKAHLTKLHQNLNILREREAKHGSEPPLTLLNKIDDYQQAIALTEQAIAGQLNQTHWYEALKPLLVSLNFFGDFFATIPLQRPARVEHFTGREKEFTQLLADLQPGRVVTLCGPGGIGKTALAAQAIWTLAPGDTPPDRFPDGLIFHSFYNQPQAALALEAIARAFREEPKPTPRDAAQRVLANRQALLVLDGAEAADDLQSVLDVRSNCGVLVTSRHHKDATAERQDIASLPLDKAITLLQAWGGNRAVDHDVAHQICELIGGLPLAVRLVGRYLAQQEEEAADYLAWLQETPLTALDQGQRHRDSVPLLLDRSLAQLSEQVQHALAVVGVLALAPFRREVVAAGLKMSTAEAGRLLGQLVSYGVLLRRTEHYETSHALIHTFARRRMQVLGKEGEHMATYYTKLVKEQSKLGPQGYASLDIERAHIVTILGGCIKWQAWETARNLAWAMERYLDLQGHWTDRIKAHEIGLEAARKMGRRQDEGMFLGYLGITFAALGNMHRAIDFHEQQLAIARELNDRREEGDALGDLGIAYAALGNIDRALDSYEQQLMITREIGDRIKEGHALSNLGNAHMALGNIDRALDFYEQQLMIARETDDRRSEGWAVGNLGNTHMALGNIDRALDFYEQQLTITREIGDRRSEGWAVGNLGNTHMALGNIDRALDFYEQQLMITREIGDRQGGGWAMGNLGNAHMALGQVGQAINYYEEAWTIAREIDDRTNEATWLYSLGKLHGKEGNLGLARQYLTQALDIFEEIKSPHAEETRTLLYELKNDQLTN